MGNANPLELFSKIRPCDTERPYAFISYCHRDGAYVWEDVLAFQNLGYNIWIDRHVDPMEEKSWNEKTADVISSINCKLVIFYTSKDSVISDPCLNELRTCKSPEAQDTHNQQAVPLIKIDVEPIRDMEVFRTQTHDRIDNAAALSAAEKNKKAKAHSGIFKLCFDKGNATVRMLSRTDPTRERDYYAEAEECFQRTRVAKLTVADRYQYAIRLLQDRGTYSQALQELEFCAAQNDPHAALLLAYIYKTGICGTQDTGKADNLLLFESFRAPESTWLKTADEKKIQGKREEAVALYLAHGMTAKDPEAFYTACKMWINMPAANYEFARRSLLDAQALGSPKAQTLLLGLDAYKNKYLKKT